MTKAKRQYPAGVAFETVLAEHLKDPGLQREYEALEPEFQIIRQIIDLRIKRKMSQAQLAEKVGTQQASIGRLEARGQLKNLDYLHRIASALDARLEIRLVPSEASGSRRNSRRTTRKV
jgi:DNA-binding XRE family transcriptional regulator